jgi:hypothetical protein
MQYATKWLTVACDLAPSKEAKKVAEAISRSGMTPRTYDDLAADAGVSKITVRRAVALFKQAGILTTSYNRIEAAEPGDERSHGWLLRGLLYHLTAVSTLGKTGDAPGEHSGENTGEAQVSTLGSFLGEHSGAENVSLSREIRVLRDEVSVGVIRPGASSPFEYTRDANTTSKLLSERARVVSLAPAAPPCECFHLAWTACEAPGCSENSHRLLKEGEHA